RDRGRGCRGFPQGATRPSRSGRAGRGRQACTRGRPLGMDAAADTPHILVVDDDTRLRDLLKSFLSRSDFRVTVASSTAEARERLAVLDFDLIVLDVMMP